MDNLEKNKTPESEDNLDMNPDTKRPVFWGIFYLCLGMIGLSFSFYSVYYSIGFTPLYGTVVAGVLIGALSLVIIVYGYRLIKRDI